MQHISKNAHREAGKPHLLERKEMKDSIFQPLFQSI